MANIDRLDATKPRGRDLGNRLDDYERETRGKVNEILRFVEVTFAPPAMAADPDFTIGDYWEGSIYYNTATNKLRVNTGASTWVDLH